jgi:hypothetical protein
MIAPYTDCMRENICSAPNPYRDLACLRRDLAAGDKLFRELSQRFGHCRSVQAEGRRDPLEVSQDIIATLAIVAWKHIQAAADSQISIKRLDPYQTLETKPRTVLRRILVHANSSNCGCTDEGGCPAADINRPLVELLASPRIIAGIRIWELREDATLGHVDSPWAPVQALLWFAKSLRITGDFLSVAEAILGHAGRQSCDCTHYDGCPRNPLNRPLVLLIRNHLLNF